MFRYSMDNLEINIRRFNDKRANVSKLAGVVKINGERVMSTTRVNHKGADLHTFWYMTEILWDFCTDSKNDYNHRLWANLVLFHSALDFQHLFYSLEDYREHLDDINQLKYNIFDAWVAPAEAA